MIRLPAQVLLNLFIAFLWMFLQDEWKVLTFFSGYLIGMALIFSMRRFFSTVFYAKRLIAVVKLFFIFIKELVLSSILVIRQILRPRINITPGIFRLTTELKGDWEITTLTLLLTLTPGSVVMEVVPEENLCYIHVMDIPESRDAVLHATKSFEKAIMEVTR
ncbi:Na+/H+ antiporter subunit E [Desulfotomaculum sp. 1211_IL3151]|uniref:Na+/H+ antiporter subunit E n=1 Tax=Desulfotomaculum sp. 1211_IL3151 TaxID=3084055 RepID=UPI002FD9787B